MGVRAPTGAAEMQDRGEGTSYFTSQLVNLPAPHGRVDRDYVLSQTGERVLTPAEYREEYFRRHPEARAICEATQNRVRVRERGGRYRESQTKRRRQ